MQSGTHLVDSKSPQAEIKTCGGFSTSRYLFTLCVLKILTSAKICRIGEYSSPVAVGHILEILDLSGQYFQQGVGGWVVCCTWVVSNLLMLSNNLSVIITIHA